MSDSSNRERPSLPSTNGSAFTYSDRFIPSRSATNQALYTLPKSPVERGFRSRRTSSDRGGQGAGDGGADEINGGGSSSIVGGGGSGRERV